VRRIHAEVGVKEVEGYGSLFVLVDGCWLAGIGRWNGWVFIFYLRGVGLEDWVVLRFATVGE
jgi:hypothetical protein